MIPAGTTVGALSGYNTQAIVEAMACDVQRVIFRHFDSEKFSHDLTVSWFGICVRRSITAKPSVNLNMPQYMQTFAEIADALLRP